MPWAIRPADISPVSLRTGKKNQSALNSPPSSSPSPNIPASHRRRRAAPTRSGVARLRMESATSSSQPEPTPPSAAGGRDWSELSLDALVLVFARLGPVEILMGSGLVCRSWLQAAREPELWRSVDMASHRVVEEMKGDVLRAMAMVAVDRSGGKLEVFSGKYFVTDELLKSPSLKTLSLISCHEVSNKGFTELVTKSPLLEDLSLELCPKIGGRNAYESTGKACPQLRRFSLRRECFRFSLNYPRRVAEALGIAAMTGLRSLSLTSSNITNDELAAVLDGCPRLETLCLRDCYKVIADDAALRARCARIKTLALPECER
ncbi:hypothetical protein PAHAL_6G061900 [Panicum hallii]|uniref:Uncharacterized protein n=2 Tax=Panicum hallii TaxID=206008 RepID=A0A2T8IFC6_9POAL|nr:hypothetical protein PAHAL_6G061900 [Panicum hallii]